MEDGIQKEHLPGNINLNKKNVSPIRPLVGPSNIRPEDLKVSREIL
ncbi:MAG: hypothetical protein HQK49_08185 [Oligoflexia bacterium]|nr:hypothetical protein [Oligoflexia bacterium]